MSTPERTRTSKDGDLGRGLLSSSFAQRTPVAQRRLPEEGVAGVFFNTAMLHYRLYKNYFPIWALGLYESTARAHQGADQASRW